MTAHNSRGDGPMGMAFQLCHGSLGSECMGAGDLCLAPLV